MATTGYSCKGRTGEAASASKSHVGRPGRLPRAPAAGGARGPRAVGVHGNALPRPDVIVPPAADGRTSHRVIYDAKADKQVRDAVSVLRRRKSQLTIPFSTQARSIADFNQRVPERVWRDQQQGLRIGEP